MGGSTSGPEVSDLIDIENVYRLKGFSGCIGCLDCAEWQWDTGPVAHQGRNKRRSKYSEVRMEVLCDESIRIWHIFFGCPGTHNDPNILECSPLFADLKVGSLPPVAAVVNIDDF